MKRLYRDRNSKMIGGVASGLATYLDIDPVLVRVGFVLGMFANGIGLLGYVILWVLVPQRPYAYDLYPEASVVSDSVPPPSGTSRTVSAATVFGGILIAVGLFALLDNLVPNLDLSLLWPLALIAMGVGLIVRHAATNGSNEPLTSKGAEPEEPRSYSSPLP